MITKEIGISGEKFRVVLTEQIISQVNNLKSLYNTAYDDPESFIGHGKDPMSNEVQDFECNCEVIMDALGCPQNDKNHGNRRA